MLRTRARAWAVTGLAALTIAGTGGVAAADDVSNDLDASVDAVAEVMSLNVGGDDGTTVLYVNPTGSGPQPADGKSGCNITGGASLGIQVTSSDPAVATVSVDGSTFTSCGTTRTVTVHPVATGSTTVTVRQTSNTTGGTFDFAPATFTVEVSDPAPANTAPTVSVTGVEPGASYPKGSVPEATCSVTDAEDGPSTFPAELTGSLDADGLGSQTASCGYTDAGGLTAEAAETYHIVDDSAPLVDYTLDPATPDGGDGWYRGDVTLTWHVTEPDSPGSLTTTGCVDQGITADQHGTTYTCSASSAGGSTGPVSVTVKRDGNGPVVAYDSAAGTLGEAGWYVSPVTATFTATDGFSGVTGAASGTTTSTVDGVAVVLDSPAFSDRAGNTTPAGSVQSPAYRIDTVAPSVAAPALTGTEGDNGWYTSAVTASFTATDATSGVAGDNPRTVSSGATQGEVTLSSPAFSDVAGNTTAAGARSATVNVDSEAPSVSLQGGPADGASYYFGSVPGAPACAAGDATSGLAGACSVDGYATSVGSHTVTATVTDVAGNVGTVSRTYTVLAWTTHGFFSPVDTGGVVNTVKAGSTVPLKFELFAGPTELTDVAAVASFRVETVNCSSQAVTDAIEFTTTGGTSLRYDATGGQFVQNWKTPAGSGVCYRTTMTARDGSTIAALFRTR